MPRYEILSAMITLEPITSGNVSLFREVRLSALHNAPSAFGSTYAKEILLTDADWLRRAERWNGGRGIGFLAMEDGAGCGIAGGFLDEADATRAYLISMWTARTHRRQGIGAMLLAAITDWARGRDARALYLMVTSSNDEAIAFYDRLGFSRTGRTEPYANDPALVEYEMAKQLR